MRTERSQARKPKKFNVILAWDETLDYDALQMAARFSGFTNYNQLVAHIARRITAETANTLQDYASLDSHIRGIVERVSRTARERLGKKPVE